MDNIELNSELDYNGVTLYDSATVTIPNILDPDDWPGDTLDTPRALKAVYYALRPIYDRIGISFADLAGMSLYPYAIDGGRKITLSVPFPFSLTIGDIRTGLREYVRELGKVNDDIQELSKMVFEKFKEERIFPKSSGSSTPRADEQIARKNKPIKIKLGSPNLK